MMLLHKRGVPSILLPEFLREVFLGQRTGLLHVSRGEATSFTFRAVNGELVSGSSKDARGRLGESMVRHGLLWRQDLERALLIVNGRGRRLAPVLRELGLVSLSDLEEALALHIREMLATALLWDKAGLLFEDQELPDAPAEDLTLRCSMGELILELVRRIPSAESVRKGLGNLERALALVANPPFRIEKMVLSAADGYVMARADGVTTASSAIATAPLPAEAVERALLGLLCTGIVGYGAVKPAAR
jgi:hypothetical protein